VITVINLHDTPLPDGAVYVGRASRRYVGSPLGNPYHIAEYTAWLDKYLDVPTHSACKEFNRLLDLARQGDLVLACWCSPKSCHADVLKARLEARLAREARHRTEPTP